MHTHACIDLPLNNKHHVHTHTRMHTLVQEFFKSTLDGRMYWGWGLVVGLFLKVQSLWFVSHNEACTLTPRVLLVWQCVFGLPVQRAYIGYIFLDLFPFGFLAIFHCDFPRCNCAYFGSKEVLQVLPAMMMSALVWSPMGLPS